MSNDTTPVESNDVDLDTFAAELFGQTEAAPEETTPEVEDTDNEDSDATEENTHIEDDTLADEDDTEEDETEDEVDEDPQPEEKPKKKNRFQERIDELNGKYREEERQRLALEARLAELEAQNKAKPKDEKTETSVDAGPSPDDKTDSGEDKYPLGEFDPNYIRDLTKFTIQQERETAKIEEQARQQEREQQAVVEALEREWQGKMETAQERYPDFQEKSENLASTFEGIDPAYGEYLGAAIMAMDYGPDVLYYLANNPAEAKAIVNSGATKATIALGRLESKFADASTEKQKARPKVSKAPTPPDTRLKGSTAVLSEVPDDTDDLDAFERKLFAKK